MFFRPLADKWSIGFRLGCPCALRTVLDPGLNVMLAGQLLGWTQENVKRMLAVQLLGFKQET